MTPFFVSGEEGVSLRLNYLRKQKKIEITVIHDKLSATAVERLTKYLANGTIGQVSIGGCLEISDVEGRDLLNWLVLATWGREDAVDVAIA